MKYQQFKQYNAGTYWTGPKNMYLVTTDQGVFRHSAYHLDYRETVKNFIKAGYTNVSICCVGKDVTILS
jgi:hypothetical protein